MRGEDSPKRTISRARRWGVTDGIRARLGSVCQRGRWAPRGVDCKVPHRLGRRTKGAIYRPGYLPLSTRFKAVRGEDSPKRTISRARRWDVTIRVKDKGSNLALNYWQKYTPHKKESRSSNLALIKYKLGQM